MGSLVDHYLGSIVAQVRANGLSNPFLFDVYGMDPPRAISGEAAAYREVALLVLGSIKSIGSGRVRKGAHYRIAAAILAEIATAATCNHCNGTGRHPKHRSLCKACNGNGLVPASKSWRLRHTECFKKYFCQLESTYENTLHFVVLSMRARKSLMRDPIAA